MYAGQSLRYCWRDLSFSGLLIASLGAVTDVAISIASTVNEIYKKTPTLSRMELFRSGMSVGRDMMSTVHAAPVQAAAERLTNACTEPGCESVPKVKIS